MIILLIPAFLLVIVQGQQIFDNELPVILQPPPLPSSSSSSRPFVQSSPISLTNDFISDSPPPPSEINPTIFTQPQPVVQSQPQLPHQAVLFLADQESKLPPNLKNNFYKNPRIADALAKSSWFGPGENHVTDRESEKIPRERIYYALKSAGLVRRRRSVIVPRRFAF